MTKNEKPEDTPDDTNPSISPSLSPEDEQMQRMLDGLAQAESEDLEAARSVTEAPGSGRVDETLERLWRDEEAAAGSSATERGEAAVVPVRTSIQLASRPWMSLAATVLIAVGLWAFWPRGEVEPPIILGASDLKIVQPRGDVVSFGEVRWEHPRAGELVFDVLVSGSEGEVSSVTGWTELAWRDPRGTEGWPEQVTIDLTARDKSGRIIGADSVEARRVR